jgi:hypothetical protein
MVFDGVRLGYLRFSTGFKHCGKTAVQPLSFLYFRAIAHFFIGFKPVSLMLSGETKAGPLKDQLPDKKLRKMRDREVGYEGFVMRHN